MLTKRPIKNIIHCRSIRQEGSPPLPSPPQEISMPTFSGKRPSAIAYRLAHPRCIDSLVRNIMSLAQMFDPTDTGCYVVVWRGIEEDDSIMWSPAVGVAVGKVAPEKMAKYARLAQEKAERLAANPEHIASFQTRDETDPANPKYPGAVRMDLDHIIISCSGFDWKFDEMVGIEIGLFLRLISVERVRDLMALSSNEHAERRYAKHN